MTIFQEALKDATISAGLLFALPLGYCLIFVIKEIYREVKEKCCGKQS